VSEKCQNFSNNTGPDSGNHGHHHLEHPGDDRIPPSRNDDPGERISLLLLK